MIHSNLDEIEIERKIIFDEIRIGQALNYFAYGDYLQCPMNPPIIRDGVSKSEFNLDTKINHEDSDWESVLQVDETLLSYYVNKYSGSLNGFIMGAAIKFDGAEWRFEEHVGSEDRNQLAFGSWLKVVEDHNVSL